MAVEARTSETGDTNNVGVGKLKEAAAVATQQTSDETNNNEAGDLPELDDLMTTLLKRIKSDFGSRVVDKRLARSLAKMSKFDKLSGEHFVERCGKELTRNLEDDVQDAKKCVNLTEESDAIDNKVIETSAMTVQKINHIDRLTELKRRTDLEILCLTSREKHLDSALADCESFSKTFKKLTTQFKAVDGHFSSVMK